MAKEIGVQGHTLSITTSIHCIGALAYTYQTTNYVNERRYTCKSDGYCAQKSHAETRESSRPGIGSQQQCSRYSR